MILSVILYAPRPNKIEIRYTQKTWNIIILISTILAEAWHN